MSTETTGGPQIGTQFDGGAEESWRLREDRRRTGRQVAIVIVFALVVAGLTYGVSSAIAPTYRASTQLLVNVNEANGLGLDAISAANQLTAQYVQLVPTDAVLATPAAKLGISVSDLRNNVSAGTVAQENLLQISATGPSASAARARAETVTGDFVSYVGRSNRAQLRTYLGTLSAELRSVDDQYARLAAQLRTAHGAQAPYIEGELGALTNQQQSLQNQATQRATAGVPLIQLVHPADGASKVAPHPATYAIVAFLVAGFIAAQLILWDRRRRRSAA